jgi:ribosome assembly protein 4
MATLLPPPKRQKVYNGIPEPEKVPIEQSPNVVVQFVSEDDGSALAPAVSLPANISREDLQSLVNRLTPKVCAVTKQSLLPHLLISYHVAKADEPVPFQFHVALPADAVTKESSRIVISKSIEADVLSHSSHVFSPEDILVVHCSPQSVFRVRPATRCSSSLSGRVIIHSAINACLLMPVIDHIVIRSLVTNFMCIVLSDREPPCYGLRRCQCTLVGSVYRNTLAYTVRA